MQFPEQNVVHYNLLHSDVHLSKIHGHVQLTIFSGIMNLIFILICVITLTMPFLIHICIQKI